MFRGTKTCILVSLVLAAGCTNDPKSWPTQPFNVSAWAGTPENDRYIFVHDLIDRDLLHGKNETEVREMLGSPSSKSEGDHALSYVVKTGGSGFNQVYILDIRFNPLSSVVETTLIRGD